MNPIILTPLLLVIESEPSLFSADQMGGYAVTALFTLTNLAVAFFFIRLLFKKLLLPVLNKRQEQINASIDEASKAEEEAKASETKSTEEVKK